MYRNFIGEIELHAKLRNYRLDIFGDRGGGGGGGGQHALLLLRQSQFESNLSQQFFNQNWFLKVGQTRALFVYFRPFPHDTIQYRWEKA